MTVTAEKPGFNLRRCCKCYENMESFTAYKRIFGLILTRDKMNEAGLYILFQVKSFEGSMNIFF